MATEEGCPSGYKACYDEELVPYSKQYCIEESKDAAKACPITDVKFVTDEELSDLSDKWTALPFVDDEIYLAFTKEEGSQGPIARQFVGYKPCLDPGQFVLPPVDNYLYAVEAEAILAESECLISVEQQ